MCLVRMYISLAEVLKYFLKDLSVTAHLSNAPCTIRCTCTTLSRRSRVRRGHERYNGMIYYQYMYRRDLFFIEVTIEFDYSKNSTKHLICYFLIRHTNLIITMTFVDVLFKIHRCSVQHNSTCIKKFNVVG